MCVAEYFRFPWPDICWWMTEEYVLQSTLASFISRSPTRMINHVTRCISTWNLAGWKNKICLYFCPILVWLWYKKLAEHISRPGFKTWVNGMGRERLSNKIREELGWGGTDMIDHRCRAEWFFSPADKQLISPPNFTTLGFEWSN